MLFMSDKFTQCMKLINFLELLTKEYHLFNRNTDTVLQVWRHIPGGCTYTGPNELVWDQAATSLAESVSSLLDIEQQNLVVARYQPKAHRWSMLPVQEDNRMVNKFFIHFT